MSQEPAWAAVRAAFEAALEQPAAARAAFLDQAVGARGELRAAVDRLLQHADTDSTFLSPPGAATLGTTTTAAARLQPGHRLGPFVLQGLLGSGGMGAVYVAEQERPLRRVAVKVLKAPLDAARSRQRFEAEIATLARLQHPGIAQVYEVGAEADGTSWFAMELIAEAAPLTRYAAARSAGLATCLELFLRVADAVHHAHQRGVIHRDLKPANILVGDGGAPKVIDFGIARTLLAGDLQLTEQGQLLGTLAYMSPEQVAGGDTDVRTDVYGLGVVLYELLTGGLPFDLHDQALGTACRTILEREPPPPSSRRRSLPAELDWVLGKALQKDPRQRYAGVAEFAADLERFRRHEPVLAAPPGLGYHLRKFVRRHRIAVAAAAAVVLVTVGALVVVTQALLRATAAEAAERNGRTIAEAQARRAAAASDFLLDVFSAVDPGKDGRDVKMADALARAARDCDARLATQPGLQSALGQTIGLAYFGLGMLDEAETHLRHSLAAAETGHGQHSPEVARVLADLALVLQRRGRLKEADAALQRGERIAATLPPTDFTTTAIATRRADLLRADGDREAARRRLEPLVARMRAARGTNDRSTLVATTLLAGVLHELGQLEAAESLYQEAFDGFVVVKGEAHPDSLTSLNNLMMVQYSRGKRRELLPTLQRLLEVRRRVLGDDHPDTITTLNNLAGVAYGLGEYDRAAPLYREAADRIREREGREHPVYARILANLATAERELGQYDAAIRDAAEAFELRREAAGPGHEGTLMTQALLADCHRFAGHFDVALPMFEQIRELAAQATPPQLANLYRCDLGIGRTMMALQRFDAAEQALLRCRDGFAAADQSMAVKGQLVPPDTNLHELYTRWGKPELAQRYAPPATK